MTKTINNLNLEKVICSLNLKTKIPNHAMPVKDLQVKNSPKFYCYDARSKECSYSLIIKNKSYCTYNFKS